ncbi:hypothetical protein [Bacillus sp. XF8]|uniref:hypothetical protein n=1 Tax=Bacillus sp. XF8 TaxID=2819289 RepID=UPI001AA056E5|nr:hypothetical protein [Bacillus sp. XF8]MBO1579975.1 hypothetical protein [Bacillus sp. XF8]
MNDMEKEQLAAQLERYRESHEELVEMRKREALRNKGFTGTDVENAIPQLNGETKEEIEASLKDLMVRLRIEERKQGADPNPGNGLRYTPPSVSPLDIGRKMYERVKEGKSSVRSLREIKE